MSNGWAKIAVRDCTEADLPASLAIFNELIPATTVAWRDDPFTMEWRAEWFARQQERGFPVLVAVDDDPAATNAVIGVASYGDFRNTPHFEGYRFTVEHSIHVAGDRRGDGTGRLLMEALVERARGAGLHVMVGAIDAENVDSIRFHERMGFVEVARMPETGFKFGRWLDLVLVQRTLD
ncbi:MAG: N-acetyltransferase family protein [Acidimicrobiia bacterium]